MKRLVMDQADVVCTQAHRIRELEKQLADSQSAHSRTDNEKRQAQEECRETSAKLVTLHNHLKEAGMGISWSLEDARRQAGLLRVVSASSE